MHSLADLKNAIVGAFTSERTKVNKDKVRSIEQRRKHAGYELERAIEELKRKKGSNQNAV